MRLEPLVEQVLAAMPQRLTLIRLSPGGYVAFEVIRWALSRLVLIDTTAVADHPPRHEAMAACVPGA